MVIFMHILTNSLGNAKDNEVRSGDYRWGNQLVSDERNYMAFGSVG